MRLAMEMVLLATGVVGLVSLRRGGGAEEEVVEVKPRLGPRDRRKSPRVAKHEAVENREWMSVLLH
jgi:hypothetical protein